MYNPSNPARLAFPKESICLDKTKNLLIMGSVNQDMYKMPEIILLDLEGNEGIHINLNIPKKVIERFSIMNGTPTLKLGEPFEGTTIDFEEPFMINLSCDADGWMVQVNTEKPYPHFLHATPHANLSTVVVRGDLNIFYIGFGVQGTRITINFFDFTTMAVDHDRHNLSGIIPMPPVGINVTYVCPQGMVFDYDWFATPFIMMTCQVTFNT